MSMSEYRTHIYRDGERLYLYPFFTPSIAPILIFLVAFTALFIFKILDLLKFCKTKGSKFVFQSTKQNSKEFKQHRNEVIMTCVPFLIGLIFEILGYLVYATSVKNPHNLSLYVCHQLMILLAPSIAICSIYMVFDRLQFYFRANDYIFIRTRFFTAIMVVIDMLIVFLQLTGSLLMVYSETNSLGSGMAIAFYSFEILFFILFATITIRFLVLLNSKPTEESYAIEHNLLNRKYKPPKWRQLIWILFISMIFIIIRNCLRLIKFINDIKGNEQMNRHEYVFFFIDSIPAFIACLLLAIARPENILWEISSFIYWRERKEANHEPGDLNYDFVTYDIYTR